MGCAKITFVSCAAIAAAMMLSSCSIRDETSDEILVQEESEEIAFKAPRTKSEFFIQKCIECAAGDLSNLEEIVETYKSTFTNSTDYPPNAFLYQRINNHQAFESCALKARLEGDTSAFDSMIVQPNKIARVARYFYAYNQPTQGAYWLQRIINVRGEVTGLEIAGRVFIQDIRTIGIGVQLLEQSARLGNRTAGQMLTGLMTPGSPYYNQLTTNNTNDYESAKDRGDGKKMKETEKEVTSLKNSLENIIENNKKDRDNAAAEAIAAGASATGSAASAGSAGSAASAAAAAAAATAGASAQAQSSRTTSDAKGIVIFDSNSKSEANATRNAPSVRVTRTNQDAQTRGDATTKSNTLPADTTKHDIGSGTAVKPATAMGDADKPRIRDYRDDVDVGTKARVAEPSSMQMPQSVHGSALEHTEDILQSSDAELNIPLEVYEQQDAARAARTSQSSATGTAATGSTGAQTDKDVSDAHKRLIERHEERLQQAKEKAEAAAAAANAGK